MSPIDEKLDEKRKRIITIASNLKGKSLTIDDLRYIASYVYSLIRNAPAEQKKDFSTLTDVASRYNELDVPNLVDFIMEYNRIMKGKTGSNFLETFIIDEIRKKKKGFVEEEEKERRVKPPRKPTKESEYGDVKIAEGAKMSPYSSKVPDWVYLRGKPSFVKILDAGNRVIIGQNDGKEGVIINNTCSASSGNMIEILPNRESCAIALTVSRVAKVLKFDTVIENSLVLKERYIGILKSNEINVSTEAKGEDLISKTALINHLLKSVSFKGAEFIFLERVEFDTENMRDKLASIDAGRSTETLSSVDTDKTPFSRNAIMDAGRVFMFELVFGISENVGGSHVVKKNLRYITKVYTNPRDIRIKKMIDAARSSVGSMIRKMTEKQIYKTSTTILDDARFIQGMHEVRTRIKKNKETVVSIIDYSDLPDREKEIIKDNVTKIFDNDISLGDLLITLSENERSPFKPRSLRCTLAPISTEKKASVADGYGRKR